MNAFVPTLKFIVHLLGPLIGFSRPLVGILMKQHVTKSYNRRIMPTSRDLLKQRKTSKPFKAISTHEANKLSGLVSSLTDYGG